MSNEFIKNKECWKEGQYPFEDEQRDLLECQTCHDIFNREQAVDHSIKEQHHSFKIKGLNLTLNIG